MKASGAVLFLLVQTAQLQEVPTGGDVACAYNERKTSCNLCPHYIQDGEVMEDFNRCGGDCQLESYRNSQICLPIGKYCLIWPKAKAKFTFTKKGIENFHPSI